MTATNRPPSAEGAEIVFEEGIIGVPRARRFQLLARDGQTTHVLRSLDIEGFALPVTDPRLADESYRPEFGPRVPEALALGQGDPVLILAVTTLEPGGATLNLRAPLVINVKRGLAAQVILDDRSYPLRAPLCAEPARELAPAT
jgi:flagellar assembly factor FliW